MKRFFTGLLVMMLMMLTSQAWSASKMNIFTMELYNSNSLYSQAGGVTTVASGVSDFTCTFNGTVATTSDNRTINLDSYSGADSRTFVVQLGVGYINDRVNGTYAGVTLSRSTGQGSDPWGGVTGNIALAFSNYDTPTGWAGTSKYWLYSKAMTGNSLYPSKLKDTVNYVSISSSTSPYLISHPVAFGRYMRAYWLSGITPFRRVPISIMVGEQ